MEQAIDAYRHVSVTPEFQELERMRELSRHNEASALRHARVTARSERGIEIAKSMIADNEPIEKIKKYTGLTVAEVEALRDAD